MHCTYVFWQAVVVPLSMSRGGGWYIQLTNTNHSDIFIVSTVVVPNSAVRAVRESCLISSATKLIQMNGRRTLTKEAATDWNREVIQCVVELSADDLRLIRIKLVITNGTPDVLEADLHSTDVISCSVYESYVSIGTHRNSFIAVEVGRIQ